MLAHGADLADFQWLPIWPAIAAVLALGWAVTTFIAVVLWQDPQQTGPDDFNWLNEFLIAVWQEKVRT